MVVETRCVTSIYRLELGSGNEQEWYLGFSVVGVTKSYQCTINYGVMNGKIICISDIYVGINC